MERRTLGRYVIALAILGTLLGCGSGSGPSRCWNPCGCDDTVDDILRTCPPVDIVYVMDTSGSMNSISLEVCDKVSGVNAELVAMGLQDIQATILGITETGSGDPDFYCLEDDVANLLGTAVPGTPYAGTETLDNDEDWGPGSCVVCANFPWRPGALRIVVPISDEGAENGGTGSDMIDEDDSAAMQNLIDVALAHNVVVSPMWGSDDHPSDMQDPAFLAALQNLATATGGTVTLNPGSLGLLDEAMFDLIVAACTYAKP